jgi:hypothetical protein
MPAIETVESKRLLAVIQGIKHHVNHAIHMMVVWEGVGIGDS